MAQHDSALSELARRLTEVDGTLASSIGEILGAALQELIEAELTARIDAEPGERSPARTVQRNSHRPKLLSTPAVTSKLGSRSYARAATSVSSSSRAGASAGRCGR